MVQGLKKINYKAQNQVMIHGCCFATFGSKRIVTWIRNLSCLKSSTIEVVAATTFSTASNLKPEGFCSMGAFIVHCDHNNVHDKLIEIHAIYSLQPYTY